MTLTFLMSLGFTQVYFTTSKSACVLVAVTLAAVASETIVVLTNTLAPVILGASIETGLELKDIAFFDCGRIPKTISSMKLVQRRMQADSLLMIGNVA